MGFVRVCRRLLKVVPQCRWLRSTCQRARHHRKPCSILGLNLRRMGMSFVLLMRLPDLVSVVTFICTHAVNTLNAHYLHTVGYLRFGPAPWCTCVHSKAWLAHACYFGEFACPALQAVLSAHVACAPRACTVPGLFAHAWGHKQHNCFPMDPKLRYLGCLSVHPMSQCVVHALEGLACRVRVTPASSPASHCKQCTLITFALRARLHQAFSGTLRSRKKQYVFAIGPKLRYPAVYDAALR